MHLYIGLMSGTSVDGVDAALVAIDNAGVPRLLATHQHAFPSDARADIQALMQPGENEIDRKGELDMRLGELFADATRELLRASGRQAREIRAIGSHGQTIRHRPRAGQPFTCQIGNPSVIAERTGITTVADFRRRDVAAGGQGAPLMPAFHAAVLRSAAEDRAILNLGGIANLTLLPREGEVRGFDTGPANGLMDAWCALHTGQPFDRGAALALAGTVDGALLARLLAEPWFSLPPPKSTGRDQFQLQWLQQRLEGAALTPADVQATLCELSAATVARALHDTQPRTQRLLVCGGGAHNPLLMARLAARLPGIAVEDTASVGLDPDFIEAAGFAWLARETLAGRPGNLPAVTGARGPRVLGAVHAP